MAVITVDVDGVDKEISGLTRKTTCADILEALLKDMKASSNVATKTDENCHPGNLDISDANSKDIQELIQNNVIIESWRGCEKQLPPQTRILTVWQAWGKEQCHVKFTLKKVKNTNFYVGMHDLKGSSPNQYNNLINIMDGSQHRSTTNSSHFLHKLSHGQKKRIRRSLMQYQRAVLNQHTKENVDDNNNLGKESQHSTDRTVTVGDQVTSSRQKTTEKSSVTLSEEQFVDGVVTGPECILRHESKFIRTALDKKEFNREHCTYRRPHHRRRSLMLDDSDGLSDQNAVLPAQHKHEIHHYPYCQKSKRRSSSRQRRHHSRKRHGRVSKCRKPGPHSSRYSTDSTTTSTGTPSTVSEIDCEFHSEGEDADDEISILAEFGASVSREKITQYPISLRPYVNRYCSSVKTSGSVINATDSSSGTTTCSETSNASSFSGTSSSETSSSADIYNESFFVKRAAAAAAAAAAKAATNEKSKASKLFKKVTGPSLSQSFIGSFKKKKKTSQPTANHSRSAALKTSDALRNTKCSNKSNAKLRNKPINENSGEIPPFQNKRNAQASTTTSEHELVEDGALPAKECQRSSQTMLCKVTDAIEDSNSQKTLEQLKQLVLSQGQALQSADKETKSTDAEIERMETQVHRWRTETHGKNYVQETYLSGSDHPMKSGVLPSQQTQPLSSPSYSGQRVDECEDPTSLAEYIEACERVVDTQMQIEECKRHAEIILQDIRDEMWKSSNDPTTPQSNQLTAAALGLVSGEDETNSSDGEENTCFASLSVANRTGEESNSATKDGSKNKLVAAKGALDLERSRTELEANLYLNLRLSTELEEVNQLMCSSQRLLQSKGESLLDIVREIAQSSEGISPQLWEDYGELLVAYDDEFSLQQYLASCAVVDSANHMREVSQTTQKEIHQPQGFQDFNPMSPTTTALHHALSPWLWCEHCKQELQHQGHITSTDVPSMPPHFLKHAVTPDNLSELPLPSPSCINQPLSPPTAKPTASTPLLPMPPIPDCNDSDYDELSEKLKNANSRKDTSAIISTEDVIPTGISFRHFPAFRQDQESIVPNSKQILHLLSSTRNHSASNTDDSGNASAASSTNSDSASIDTGSRNSSCDGGSPRPTSIGNETQDSTHSSSFFRRDNVTRESEKLRFFFPLQRKVTSEDASKLSLKCLRSPTSTNQTKDRSNLLFKSSKPANPGAISSATFDKNHLEQQKRLIRRNSSRHKRPAPAVPQSFEKRASSFGKGEVRLASLPSHLNNIVKQPIVYNSHCDLTNDKNTTPSHLKQKHLNNCELPLHLLSKSGVGPSTLHSPATPPCSPFIGSNTANFNRRDLRRVNNAPSLVGDLKKSSLITNNYDNDSDTGLSSLHSTDSVDMLNMYSETLV